MKKVLFLGLLISLCFQLNAQDSTSFSKKLSFEVFTEVYYVYDFNQPEDHIRQPFLFNYNRHNEVNLNLGLIKTTFEDQNIRGNFALQAGTFPQDNFSHESELLRSVFEANIGVKLNNNLWLTAGIFSSHLGFESPIADENLSLTRSLLAEASPYYLSGVKLDYSFNSALNLALVVSNGWQRTTRINGNQIPCIGTQANYKKNNNLELNWSSFFGSDTPDSVRQYRFFNDFYVKYKFSQKVEFNLGFDIGMQQASYKSSDYNYWFGPLLIAGYKIHEKVKVAARLEYFSDPNLIIVKDQTSLPFKTLGYSVNADIRLSEHAVFRLEGRGFDGSEKVFLRSDSPVRSDFFISTSVIGRFK